MNESGKLILCPLGSCSHEDICKVKLKGPVSSQPHFFVKENHSLAKNQWYTMDMKNTKIQLMD